MALQFEILKKDIAGRIGRLTDGKKSVNTPAILPVINPHVPIILPRTLQELGVEALITNAYIISKSREFRNLALEQGLHTLLDFDGVIMTDSGSFQLSVYGEVEITNEETLKFQQDIGSDIIVPLDIPTSPDCKRKRAEEELAITLDRLKEAKDSISEEKCTLAGPVQGGAFLDLREKAARSVSDLGFSFCPFGAVVPLMEAYRYRELVDVVMAGKRGVSPSACVHLFGAGHPAMFALAVVMGCDLFDSAAYALYAKDGRYMTTHGSHKIDELTYLPCSCDVCRTHTVRELKECPEQERLLALHNLYVTLAEMDRIRQAIVDGVLWELVDERCRSHPSLLSGYRRFLEYAGEMVHQDRATKRRFFYHGDESCRRTEVIRYHQMIPRFTAGSTILVSFDRIQSNSYDTVFFFKPPFGPYPPELKETFPIGQSELPPWDDEMVRTGCQGILKIIEAHPKSTVTIQCSERWKNLVLQELPSVGVLHETV